MPSHFHGRKIATIFSDSADAYVAKNLTLESSGASNEF